MVETTLTLRARGLEGERKRKWASSPLKKLSSQKLIYETLEFKRYGWMD